MALIKVIKVEPSGHRDILHRRNDWVRCARQDRCCVGLRLDKYGSGSVGRSNIVDYIRYIAQDFGSGIDSVCRCESV